MERRVSVEGFSMQGGVQVSRHMDTKCANMVVRFLVEAMEKSRA
jgi:hypothetical protein